MKGIILAGGSGTRLHPLTLGMSKQLLAIYNKPMIYYPLSILMLAGIQDILVITTQHEQFLFKRLLGNGSQFGINISYAEQAEPKGIAQALLISETFLENDDVCLILGDNIFYGHQLPAIIKAAIDNNPGCTLFGFEVQDPSRYGVIEVDENNSIVNIEEKPKHPKSNLAVTGLYIYDNMAVSYAKELIPSQRGELEITCLNNIYINKGKASLKRMGRGYTWFDAGTFDSLMQANHFVQVIEERQGHYIAALEEIAFLNGFINRSELLERGKKLGSSPYGQYLKKIATLPSTEQLVCAD